MCSAFSAASLLSLPQFSITRLCKFVTDYLCRNIACKKIAHNRCTYRMCGSRAVASAQDCVDNDLFFVVVSLLYRCKFPSLLLIYWLVCGVAYFIGDIVECCTTKDYFENYNNPSLPCQLEGDQLHVVCMTCMHNQAHACQLIHVLFMYCISELLYGMIITYIRVRECI